MTNTMKNLLKYVAAGLFYAFVPEITNIIIINKMPITSFIYALMFYTVCLVGWFLGAKLLKRLVRSQAWFAITYILVTGAFGLAIEWFMVGNSPWQNPSAIQYGMFVYWVGLFMFSLMLSEENQKFLPLKKNLLKSYIIYSVIHLIISLSFSPGVLIFIIPLLWTLAYTLLAIYYPWYIKIAKRIGPSKSF